MNLPTNRQLPPSALGRSNITWLGLRSEIMDRITSGTYAAGALIPTEQELAAEFGCARATVNRALTSLAERGVLNRRRRIGTRVALGNTPRARLPVLRDMVEEQGRSFRSEFRGGASEPMPRCAAERLFRSDPARIRGLCTLFYADEMLFCAERRWIDEDALPDLTDEVLGATTANEWLARRTDLDLIERTVTARTASEIDAAVLLGCPQGAPLLVYETCIWIGARPVSFAQHAFLPGQTICRRMD